MHGPRPRGRRAARGSSGSTSPPGEQLLLTGANGSGKSTLLSVARRAAPPAAGVGVGRRPVHARRSGYLPQDVRVPPIPVATAAAGVRTSATARRVPLRDLGLLHPRDLDGRSASSASASSAGSALASWSPGDPDLVLLDEPTNHLSLALADELEEALQRAARARSSSPATTGGCREHWAGTVVGL